MANPKIKAVFFDFMGTCLNWELSIVAALPSQIPKPTRSALAIEWRHDYFDYNARRLADGLPPEDIDISMRNTLDVLLGKPAHKQWKDHFDQDAYDRVIRAWHDMSAWPDVAPAIKQLKSLGYEVFVFANGTTRLQLDLCRSSGLEFDMLFSSQLLGHIKPDRRSYLKVLDVLKYRPEETVMVACHAYDNRGAKAVGMRTVYVRRWTDDVNEDMAVVRGEDDEFLDEGGMQGLVEAVGRL